MTRQANPGDPWHIWQGLLPSDREVLRLIVGGIKEIQDDAFAEWLRTRDLET